MTEDIKPEELWKAIVLYGLNQATYKMALGKVLLKFSEDEATEIQWADLSKAFLDQYIDRLEAGPHPQQATSGRLTKMERIVTALKEGSLTYEEAVDAVSSEGFNDVVPRFQTIGSSRELVGSKFFEIEFGKKLTLTNDLIQIAGDRSSELLSELEARWSLLEGAFSINQSTEVLELSNTVREIFLRHGTIKRASLTNNIPFLAGYQGNACFYCGEPITGTPHVDHLLPRQVVMHDSIWNLVLCDETCNLQKSDKMVGEHFLQKLIFRNENIMGSNHPWKKKIAAELGSSNSLRIKTTKKYYEMVKVARGEVYWGTGRAYNPSTDDFYRKFVTILNNGETLV